jgi:hypothetical protein
LYKYLTQDTKAERERWKNEVIQKVKDASENLSSSRNGEINISGSDKTGLTSSVGWIGGFTLFNSYSCRIKAECNNCCYNYKCKLTNKIKDAFEEPSDFNHARIDFWDEWNYGGTPYNVVGEWEETITGGGVLK